ncbi:MAG: AAA family ATPase, partial [Sandaracinaceae bacterium]|nr:AAA family ATPase [Sandaracinaceae bacterium]
MRIRAIRGRGLASLAAPFELDLDAAPMRGAGVFVIGGPTGAGKSTILDAMCLALFDRAPRLARSPQRDVVRAGTRSALGSDRASEVEGEGDAARGSTPVGAGKGRVASAAEPDVIRTSDPRAIVRRGARHAFAEVDFEARGGGLFRARWEVRAVRRRDGGWSLGKPTMSLVVLGARAARDGDAARAGATPRGPLLADAGLRVGTTKTDVLAQIEARLGLDYGQFCRSVLLPQGELASFLEAPDDERARLLERVTGTEIYSTLSRVVHTRAATLVREARERSLEIDALPLLSEPERDELVVQRDEAAIEAARAQKRVAELVASERAHETLRVLASELGQAERELDDVSRQLGLWEPRRGEVTLALRAREVRAEREVARSAAVERGRAEAELSSVSARLEESEPALTRAATEVREAEGELR